MDDQTPEMERVTAEMRELMQMWLADPTNTEIKQRFDDVHARYQRMFIAYRRSGDGVASGGSRGAFEV